MNAQIDVQRTTESISSNSARGIARALGVDRKVNLFSQGKTDEEIANYKRGHPIFIPQVRKYIDALGDSPNDSLLRLRFADYLHEAGLHNAANGQQYLANHGKFPLSHIGWQVSSGPNLGGQVDTHYTLPQAFSRAWDYDRNTAFHPINNRIPSEEHGTLPNEYDFLDASHQMSWKNGEPV